MASEEPDSPAPDPQPAPAPPDPPVDVPPDEVEIITPPLPIVAIEPALEERGA